MGILEEVTLDMKDGMVVFDMGKRTRKGTIILEFTQAYDLALENSFFKKREEHYVTYMSGTNRTVID